MNRQRDIIFLLILTAGTAFTVEWEKVVLQDKPGAGSFTFQVTLHQNGDIVFVYSDIPMKIDDIEDTMHPVKVGVSDAYIMDRTVFCECALSCLLPNLSTRPLDDCVTVAATFVAR